MSSLRERPRSDGTTAFQVVYREHGKQRSATFETRPAALRFQADLEESGATAARRRLTTVEQTGVAPRLSEWFTHHIDQLTDATEGTRAGYRSLARRTWVAEMDDPHLDVIVRADVTGAINRLAKRLSAKSVRNAHGLLVAALDTAVLEKVIEANPARNIRLPKWRPPTPRALTYDELGALIDALPEHYRPLVRLMAATGLRWGEATALRVCDFDLSVPELRVEKAWKQHVGARRAYGTPKTLASIRTVALSPWLVPVIGPLLAGRKRDALVFTTPSGAVVTHAHFHARVWRPACAAAGLEPPPQIHGLRHAHATYLIAAGHLPSVVQERLGHEDPRTTLHLYTHIGPEVQRAAIAAADVPQIGR